MHYVGHDMALDEVHSVPAGAIADLLGKHYDPLIQISSIRADGDGRVTVTIVDEDEREVSYHPPEDEEVR